VHQSRGPGRLAMLLAGTIALFITTWSGQAVYAAPATSATTAAPHARQGPPEPAVPPTPPDRAGQPGESRAGQRSAAADAPNRPAKLALTVSAFNAGGPNAKRAAAPAAAATPTPPFNECPAVGADISCAVLIVVGSGSIQVLVDSSQRPFDGADDTLVGVLNSSGSTVAHIALSANAPVFSFDGDGICTFPQLSGCPFGPTGYEGPGTVFSGISPGATGGTVAFANGLSSGTFAYFSLEVAIDATTFVSSGPTVKEQGGPPSRSENPTTPSCGAPVNCATGEFWHQYDDLHVPGRGPSLAFSRTYISATAGAAGRLGFGWTDSYNMSLAIEAGGNVTVKEENGATVTFAPNGSGGFVAPSRVLATLTHNADGTYTFTRHKDKIDFRFSAQGQLLSEADGNGYTTSMTYAGSQLASVTDPAGRTLSFTYTGANISTITDPIGRTESFTYDAAGNLTTATDPAGSVTTFGYDSNHLLLTITDPLGGKTSSVYDSSGRVTSQTDPAGRTITWAYAGAAVTASGGTTTMTDPRGSVTTYQFQNLELVSRTAAAGTPLAATSTYQYDPVTLGVSTTTDPLGHVTRNTYDSHGNVLTTVDALNDQTSYTYDSLDDVLTITDPLGVTTTMTYDSRGNLLTTSRPLTGTSQVATTTLTYGDATHSGDVTATTDAGGNVSHTIYDQFGNVMASTDPAGDTRTVTYDIIGRQTSSVAPNGNVSGANPASFTTTNTYNAVGLPVKVVDPLGRTTTYTYDANRNRKSVTDANGHVTTFTSDADNETTVVTRPDGSTQKTAYDGDGNAVSQVDGLGNTTTYTFDALNRVASVKDPLNRATTHTYDGAGNPKTIVDTQSQTTSYGYDAANRLTSITYSDGKTPNVSLAYDADGQRTSMTDGTGTSTYTYDSLRRLTSSVTGAGGQVTYGYDLRGLVTSLVYPGGMHTVTRGYDNAGRLTSVTDWLAHTTTFTYDADSNLRGQAYPNATQAARTYDAADQLASIGDKQGTNTFLSISYQRDGIGQITQESDTKDTYDANDRQVGWANAQPAYAYDAADRLTQRFGKTLTYDAASELQKLGSIQYGYDLRGNRTSVSTGGVTTTIGYDQANRTASYGTTATYGYNGDGLRTSKTVSGQATQFTYDVSARSTGLPLIIQAGGISYVTGPGGLALEQVAADGTVQYFHQDQLGSTRALTDSTGAVVLSNRYNPYGNLTASNGTATTPFQFAGQYLDVESGLYFMRARYYDPASGQFTTRDPFSRATGQPYAYARDNPTNGVDPSGLVDYLKVWNSIGPWMGPVSVATGILGFVLGLSSIETVVGPAVGVAFEGLSLATGAAAAVWDCTHSVDLACAFSVAGSALGAVGIGFRVMSMVFRAAAAARGAAASAAWAGSGNILLRALRYAGHKALEFAYGVLEQMALAVAQIWSAAGDAIHSLAQAVGSWDLWLQCGRII
jgi:RHS repeat-associated protein